MRPYCMGLLLSLFITAFCSAETDLRITAKPYMTGGLFTSIVIPQEGDAVTITVRATVQGELEGDPQAKLTLRDASGLVLSDTLLTLTRKEGLAEGTWSWTGEKNGMYSVQAVIDPENKISEKDETNNSAEILLPVTIKGRKLFFPWFAENRESRWTTIVAAAREDAAAYQSERGIMRLQWNCGGLNFQDYDKEEMKRNPEKVATEVEEKFFKMFSRSINDYAGFGIDEFGGYPASAGETNSKAAMKGLIRARKANPDRFFAVWHGGALRPEQAGLYHQGVDLLMCEAYLWRAIPEDLSIDDIYQHLRDRLDPVARMTDMLVSSYGNPCHTLIALETDERPDQIPIGELEQVVRFIREICPEMRGIAWYNAGYGNYHKPTPETDRKLLLVRSKADELCLKYFIKPCVTLMRESLWLTESEDGSRSLTLAVSNIGAMDSGPVTVEFFADGQSIGTQKAAKVPAGANRLADRVLLTQPISRTSGYHRFEARIVSASDATVLTPSLTLKRVLP